MAGVTVKSPGEYFQDDSKEDSLWEWINSSGQGVMGFEFGSIPDECFNFCLTQYARFGVPMSPELHEVITVGGSASFYFADVIDPYALFEGVSDVNMTQDWAYVAYKIFDPRFPDKRSYEPRGEQVETFVFMPGQAEEKFNFHMARPGLDALPEHHGFGIRDVLSGDYRGDEGIFESVSNAGEAAIIEACTVVGPDGAPIVDQRRVESYFELAAWAAYLWLIGPESRDWRMYRHEVMQTAINYGECLIVDHEFISPKYYSKFDRPPQSCYLCGVQSWCVEHTQIMNHTGFICEACSNFDMPKSGVTNCGTKFCTFSPCPNHPYHHLGEKGAFAATREKGYLLDVARGKVVQSALGSTPSFKQLGI